MEFGLEGRVAVVTGATRGIGRRVAIDLAAEGCRLVLCARDVERLDAVVDELHEAGTDAVAIAGDLRDSDTATEVAAQASRRFGRIDILVNNAGIGTPKKLLELTDGDWNETFELNFFAVARLSAACVPSMLEQGWGRIVNIASVHGREPDPMFGPYSASKAALLNLTKCYGRAFSKDGVLTNCVVPGITATEMVKANTAAAAAAMAIPETEVLARTLARAPIAV
ncbi:MAG: SDR family NAD(P)-dependent oxidoreductase, partial [Acidimicrobiales bacterium]